MKNAIILLAVSLLLSACGGATVRDEPGTVPATVNTVKPIQKKQVFQFLLPDAISTANFEILGVEGLLMGKKSGDAVIERIAENGGRLTFRPDHLEEIGKDQAKKFEPAELLAHNNGISVSPSDTQITRLVQVVSFRAIGGQELPTRFEDEEGNRLLLLYVDRPSTISGVRRTSVDKLVMDIRLPESGLYWIKYDWNANVARLHAIQPPETVFIRGM